MEGIPNIERKDFILVIVIVGLFVATIIMSAMYFAKQSPEPKGYICWNNKWVEDTSQCPDKLCQVPEEYTESEDYTDFEGYTDKICFNSTKVNKNCTTQNVKYSKTNPECTLNPTKVSCTINNLDTAAVDFTVKVGFEAMFGRVGEEQAKTIQPGSSATFEYTTEQAVSGCYCEDVMPTKEICLDIIEPIELCQNVTKYNPVIKQRKITKYRTVEKSCE